MTTSFEPRALPARPGPLERALASLWTPRVRSRLYRPGHWRDLYHLRRHYDLRELHPNELKVDFLSGKVPDCDGCMEVCCTGRHRVVLLRLVDIAALVDAGLGDHVVMEKPSFPDEELRGNDALHDLVHSEAWRRMPILRQDATRTCSLLTGDNRCGAFPAWPLSCARFPYAVDIVHERVFYARSCGSVQRDLSRAGRRREAELVDAAVDSYNQRLRDAVLMRIARPELVEMGFGRWVKWD